MLKIRFFVPLFILTAIILFFPFARTGVHALSLLSAFGSDFFLSVDFSDRWLVRAFAEPVEHRVVEFSSGSRTLHADWYIPIDGEPTHSTAILVYGATSISDPRISRMGNALAETGIAVFVPELPELAEERGHPQTALDLINAFRYLQESPESINRKMGFLSFCIGASLALVAAEDPAIADSVAYIYAAAPYYDLVSFGVDVFSSQYQNEQGQWVTWEPNEKTMRMFRNNLIENLTTVDQKILETALSRQELSMDDELSLSDDGERIWAILHTKSRDELEEHFEGLSDEYRGKLAMRSPSSHIDRLKAPVLLSFGYDSFISASETRRLQAALGDRAQTTHFESFRHVTPTFNELSAWEKVRDGIKFWNQLRTFFQLAS